MGGGLADGSSIRLRCGILEWAQWLLNVDA